MPVVSAAPSTVTNAVRTKISRAYTVTSCARRRTISASRGSGRRYGTVAPPPMIPRADVLAVLAKVPLFEACSKGDLRIVARHLEVVQCDKDAVLIREGDAGDSFVVLLQGTGSVWHGRTKVDTLNPG